MAIKILPGFYQQNQVSQALVLPIALVLSLLPEWAGSLCRTLSRKKYNNGRQ
jgi:hypothetical protein